MWAGSVQIREQHKLRLASVKTQSVLLEIQFIDAAEEERNSDLVLDGSPRFLEESNIVVCVRIGY